MMPRLVTGRIVWADVADPNGYRKLRPAVIVTPTEEIAPSGSIDVVAVTSRLENPLPDEVCFVRSLVERMTVGVHVNGASEPQGPPAVAPNESPPPGPPALPHWPHWRKTACVACANVDNPSTI